MFGWVYVCVWAYLCWRCLKWWVVCYPCLAWNIIQDGRSRAFINSFLNKRGSLQIWLKTDTVTSWVKQSRSWRRYIAFRGNVSSLFRLRQIMIDPSLLFSLILDGLMWIQHNSDKGHFQSILGKAKAWSYRGGWNIIKRSEMSLFVSGH